MRRCQSSRWRNSFEDNRRARQPHAAGIIEAIDRGVEDTMAGRAAALVTGPIAKKVLYDAGFGFPATPNIWRISPDLPPDIGSRR